MSNETEVQKEESKSRAGAVGAGAGGGTLLVLLAESLPADNPWKSLLLYAAPSVSILLSSLWLWCQFTIINFIDDRKVQSLEKQARETIQHALENPETSEEHRAAIRSRLEELELSLTDRQLRRIRSLVPPAESTLQIEEQAGE